MVYFTLFRQTGTRIAVRSSGLHCQVDLCVTVHIAFLPVHRNERSIPYNFPRLLEPARLVPLGELHPIVGDILSYHIKI